MSDPAKVYVVARVGWEVDPREPHYTSIHPDGRDVPGPEDRRFVPVAAFADRAAAEARAWELEREAARLYNPFVQLGPLSVLTRRPEEDFRRRLTKLAGPLPEVPLTAADRIRTWYRWWDEHAPGWSDETVAAVWEVFDAVRFYAVLEVASG